MIWGILFDVTSVHLLYLIKKNETFRADTLIALPRIVVIGGQSSASMIHARYLYFLTFSSAGKSSLVEAVTGVSRAFCNVSSPPSSQIEDSRSKG